MSKLTDILKKIASGREGKDTYVLVTAGLTGFIMIFIVNAMIGIYSIISLSENLKKNIDTINLTRNIQLEMQNQFMSWQNILISGDRFLEFQMNYHKFSYHSQKVQNLTFNLKLENSDYEKIVEKTEMLAEMHKKITQEFTGHIVDMKDKNFTNVPDKIVRTRGKDEEIIQLLNRIVTEIESMCDSRISETVITSIAAAVVSFLFFITLTVIYGRETARRILNTHSVLEKMVDERTAKYLEANKSLEEEIEEHRKTESKLIQAGDELKSRNELLTISEKRYRVIFEGTKDIFFTLDENWNFLNANKSIKNVLKITPENVLRFKLTDLISGSRQDDSVSRKIITEKIEKARADRTPVSFTAFFKTPNLIEPVELRVYMEFIETEGHFEIIGKSSPVSEDRTTDFFVCEKTEYSIGNQLFSAEEISQRITKNLSRYTDRAEINVIRLGLREMIINAIEHGNLEISFEEKTRAMVEEKYFEFINRRQEDDRYRDRKVRIEYMISDVKAVYKITDRGKGFNHKKVMAEASEKANEEILFHGRGIQMASGIFDEVIYNKKGNQVLLVKYFSGSPAN